jgi:hypothetical protein
VTGPGAGPPDEAARRLSAAFDTAAAARDLPAHAAACRAILADPGQSALHPVALLGAARAALHQPEAWAENARAALLDRLAALHGDAPASAGAARGLVAGLAAYAADDAETAWRLMAEAGRDPGYAALRPLDDATGPPGFMRPFPTPAALAAAASPARPLTFLRRFAAAPRLVVSVSMDTLYAEAFGPDWLAAMPAVAAAGAGLHLHLIAGGRAWPEDAAALLDRAAASGLDLALSTEDQAGWERAYYASARFFHAPALLEAFGCPILFSDADARLSDPARFVATGLPALLAEARIAAFFNAPWRYGYLPWRRFSANAVLLPANAAGRAFAARAAACLAQAWDPARGPLWWIDQLALEAARRSLLREGWGEEAWLNFAGGLGRLIDLPPGYKEARLAAAPRVAALMAAGLGLGAALAQLRRAMRQAG